MARVATEAESEPSGRAAERRDGRRARALWTTVGGSKRDLALLVVSSTIAGFAEAVLLATLVQLATALSGEGSRDALDVLPGVTLDVGGLFWLASAAGVVRLALQLVTAYIPARLSTAVLERLRAELFGAFVNASWELQSTERDGKLLQILTGYVGRCAQAMLVLATGLTGALNFAALVITALVLNFYGAMVLAAAAGVLFLVLRPLSALSQHTSRDLAAVSLELSEHIAESVQIAEELHVFGVGGARARQVELLNHRMGQPYFRAQLLTRSLGAIYQGLAVSVIIAALGVLYATGASNIASLGAVVLLLVRALTYSQSIQAVYHNTRELVPFAELVREALDRYGAARVTGGDVTVDRVDSVEFRHVSYAYRDGEPVVDDLSFRIERGQTVGLVGPSGAGKSTCVQLLLRLRSPDAGAVEVNDVDIRSIDTARWHQLVAYVPQDPKLLQASVRENIRFLRDGVSDEEIVRAAIAAHLHDEVMSWPLGYDQPIGQRADAISGGQRQRIAIARALVGRPELLVLDEPTSSLDVHSEAAVQDTLMSLRGEMTLLIVAHRMSTLTICDRVMVLRNGALEAFAAHADLVATNEFYAASIGAGREAD